MLASPSSLTHKASPFGDTLALSAVSSSGALEAHILGAIYVATAAEEEGRAPETGISRGEIFAMKMNRGGDS